VLLKLCFVSDELLFSVPVGPFRQKKTARPICWSGGHCCCLCLVNHSSNPKNQTYGLATAKEKAEDYLDGKPAIITAALTGGVQGKETVPAPPETPEEIGEAAAGAVEAGASIVHIHACRSNGERSFKTETFETLDAAIRERADDGVSQHSTGGTGTPGEFRHNPLGTDPAPGMASLDVSPMNRCQ
jgi:hypothetical protein